MFSCLLSLLLIAAAAGEPSGINAACSFTEVESDIYIALLTELIPKPADSVAGIERFVEQGRRADQLTSEDEELLAEMKASARETSVYLLLDDCDPPKELLEKIPHDLAVILPGSTWTKGAGPKFTVGHIEWEDEATVSVIVKWYFASRAAGVDTYILKLQDSRWIVSDKIRGWIS